MSNASSSVGAPRTTWRSMGAGTLTSGGDKAAPSPPSGSIDMRYVPGGIMKGVAPVLRPHSKPHESAVAHGSEPSSAVSRSRTYAMAGSAHEQLLMAPRPSAANTVHGTSTAPP